VIDDGVITTAQVGVGGVANIPLRLANVEAALRGQPATDTTFENVAQRASEGATPPVLDSSIVLLYYDR
jgi:xanthine dehydrogenase YagS FAD-binding subunit